MGTANSESTTSLPAGAAIRPTLRFITCGSVDDGKSTLIGRLLHESKSIFDDQMTALANDSRQFGTQGEKIDFALLVDGLQAEREQGITIDVAYRFFATDKRRFIVADTPGHEQYTRNMATGASTADLAIILIDARKGVLTQTRRHSRIVAMMGIRQVVLAVNKMDLVAFDPAVFADIVAEFHEFAKSFAFTVVQAIPLSALDGDNIMTSSPQTPWYDGPSLMDYLDSVDVASVATATVPGRFVCRCSGSIAPISISAAFAGGSPRERCVPGDAVRILPSGVTSRVKEIIVKAGSRERAGAGESVTLTLSDEVDVSRGDMIVAAANPPQVSDQFEVRLLWMSEQPLVAGRPYLLKMHTKEVTATVTTIKYREDVNSGAHLAARTLALNEIAVVNLSTQPAGGL